MFQCLPVYIMEGDNLFVGCLVRVVLSRAAVVGHEFVLKVKINAQ